MNKDINIRVGADISELEKNLSKAQRALQRSGQKMSKMGNDMIMSLSVPILALGGTALKAAGDFEAMSNGLTAIMGDADAAAKELELLKEAAKNPGLGMNQAVQGSVRLQSIGLGAEMARTNMLAMGNAIALVGGGAAELDRATLAVQQIGAKGKVSAEEINQLNEVIPQIRAVMKDAFGTSDTQELQKMGIDAEQFIAGITTGLQKLPQATGGIKNAIENAGIAMTTTLSSLGTSLNEAFNITGRVDGFSATMASLAERFSNLDNGVKRVIFSIAGIIAAIGPAIKLFGMFQLLQSQVIGTAATLVGTFGKLQAVAKSFTSVQAALNVVMSANPVGVVVVAVAALSAAFYALYQNSETFRNGVDMLYNQALKPFFNFLVEIGGVIFDVFKSVGSSVLNVGKSVWDTFSAMQMAVINFVGKIPIVGKAVAFIKESFVIAGNLISKIFANLPAVFKGLTAEAKETGEDLKRYFENIALTAQIIAQKVQKALTLDDEGRAAINKSIAKLTEQKAALSKQGKAFGEAFKEAYNAEISKVKAPTVSVTGGSSAPAAVSGGSVSGGSFDAANVSQSNYKSTVEATTAAIKEQNQVFGENATALEAVGGLQVQGSGMADRMAASMQSLNTSSRSAKQGMEEMQEMMATFNEGLTSILNQGLNDVANGFGEVVGAMASGTASMGDLGGMLLGTLGGLLGNVGKLAISTGVAMLGIKTALQSLNPAVAIAGGIALVALSKVVSAKAESLGGGISGAAFAKGGIVDKPTFGVFGEAGTEVIIPKKRLDTYLSDMNSNGGGGNGNLMARISGRDLLVWLDKERGKAARV